mmetsp:Transcript_24566/g.40271  ORF Transcript_24566/g.40271 Transcript_24566/m.40271 type:complete len:353 (-) Transcript_24566:158-1216(-)
MVQFEEAMDALSDESESAASEESHPSKKIAVNQDDDENDDDGFFIDSSDHQVEEEDADSDYEKFLQLSSSPDSVVHVPQVAAPKPSFGGGMRRVMSVASLSSTRMQKFSLSSMVAISEEGDHSNGDDNPKKSTSAASKQSVLGGSRKPSTDVTPDNGLSLNNNHQPSRRSSQSSSTSGMPLRSNLKSSNNNLRSSLKSQNSSNSSMDASNHSIESNNSKAMKRNVSFSNLEIRSYNVTLGDAPTSNGPAISLDWEYDPTATAQYEIDHYENYRTDEAPRRKKQEMRMPPMHRQYLLMREAGFTRGEIKDAMEEAKRVAKQRQKTAKGARLGFVQPVEEVLEKTRRKFFGKRR